MSYYINFDIRDIGNDTLDSIIDILDIVTDILNSIFDISDMDAG